MGFPAFSDLPAFASRGPDRSTHFIIFGLELHHARTLSRPATLAARRLDVRYQRYGVSRSRQHLHRRGPILQKEFGLSNTQLGWVFSSFVIGYALFQVPGGRLVDRYGPRRTLLIATIWWAVFTSLTAMVPSGIAGALLILLSVRLALGLGEAVVYPSSNRLVSKWISDHGARCGQWRDLRGRRHWRGRHAATGNLHPDALRLALDVLDPARPSGWSSARFGSGLPATNHGSIPGSLLKRFGQSTRDCPSPRRS